QRKLQRNDGTSGGTDGRHLLQAGHLAKLPFQGCRNGRRDHIRAGARIEGQHLDRGVVHLRQRRHRQLVIGHCAGEQDGHHQQGRRDWSQDEGSGGIHSSPFALLVPRAPTCIPCLPTPAITATSNCIVSLRTCVIHGSLTTDMPMSTKCDDVWPGYSYHASL